MGLLLERMSLKFAPDTPQEVLLDWLEEQGADSRVVQLLRDKKMAMCLKPVYWIKGGSYLCPYAYTFEIHRQWPLPPDAFTIPDYDLSSLIIEVEKRL